MTKTVPRLAMLSVVLTYILLLIGSVTRNISADVGGPEWFHRLFALFVGLTTLTLAISIWTSRLFRSTVGVLAGVAILLLILQVGLGAITISQSGNPTIVTLHLLLGSAFFALMIWIRRKTVSVSIGIAPLTMSTPKTRVFRNHVLFCLALIFIQIGLGSMVSSSHAGLACPDFPMCNGLWLPPLVGVVGLQMFHRYMACAILLIVIGTVAVARRAVLDPNDRCLVRFCLIAVITQILLGVGLIHAQLPIPMVVAHLGVTMILFGLFTALAFGTRRA